MEKILWADDEIDLLKPHIMFLKAKGYDIETVSNGRDALDALDREPFALVLLDENMPGLSGLETLARINQTHPEVPVIMISDQTGQPESDPAVAQKESAQREDRRPTDNLGLSAGVRPHLAVDQYGLYP